MRCLTCLAFALAGACAADPPPRTGAGAAAGAVTTAAAAAGSAVGAATRAAAASGVAATHGAAAAPRSAVATGAAAGAAPTRPYGHTDPSHARALIAAGAPILDVREPDEFAAGHVAAAINLPLGELETRLAEVAAVVGPDRGREVVVYCAVGARAAKARQLLERAGYTAITNGGGYADVR